MKNSFIFFISCLPFFVIGGNLYKFIPFADTLDEYNLGIVGNNSFSSMQAICDSNPDCQGFTTWGYFKKNVTNYLQNSDDFNHGLYIKTNKPEPKPLPKLVPLPKIFKNGDETVHLSPNFQFSSNISSTLLQKAFDRYNKIIFDDLKRMRKPKLDPQALLKSITVNVGSSDETLDIETSEWYTLEVSLYAAKIEAVTIYGAMRALETFSQLIYVHYTSSSLEYYWPQFPHRGIMIDSPRHWLPIRAILDVIEGMSYAKLNVLHWHLVDDESFPIEVISYPNLWQGSFSNEERYTQEELAFVVNFAKERGIRVIPEFDGPGHMFSWGVGYPDLWPENWQNQTNCNNACNTGDCTVPVDVSSPLLFPLLKSLFSEMIGESGIFQDSFVHFGGDEVMGGCWNGSARIRQFMKDHDLVGFGDLYYYYVNQTHNMAANLGKTVINWEEVWENFQYSISKNTVINVWLGSQNYAAVLASGFRAILSNYNDWYLDYLGTPFSTFYLNDPYGDVDPQYWPQVLGGTTPMWEESTDGSVEVARIFPRGAAFGERMWNYFVANEDDSVEKLLPRLRDFRCRILLKRGILAGPVYGITPEWFSSCYDT